MSFEYLVTRKSFEIVFFFRTKGGPSRGERADSIFGKRNVSLSRKSRLLHSLKISKESNIVGIVGVRTRSTYVIVSHKRHYWSSSSNLKVQLKKNFGIREYRS